MANANRPFGLVPVAHLDGSPFNGKTTMYLFSGTNAVYLGDPVKHGGSSASAGVFVNGVNCEGMPVADRAAAGDALLGVVVAFSPLQSDTSVVYKAADGVDRIGYVVDAPDVVFEVQADNGGAAYAAGDIGENADMITWTAGNTVTGISAIELDSSDHKTATAQLRTLRLAPRADNAFGDYAKLWVVINEHEFKSTTGS